jgi:hypothetical protein
MARIHVCKHTLRRSQVELYSVCEPTQLSCPFQVLQGVSSAGILVGVGTYEVLTGELSNHMLISPNALIGEHSRGGRDGCRCRCNNRCSSSSSSSCARGGSSSRNRSSRGSASSSWCSLCADIIILIKMLAYNLDLRPVATHIGSVIIIVR